MVVGQTAPRLADFIRGETDLTNDAARVADGEDGDGMAFATGAFGAACAMANKALEQRAAEDIAGLRETGEEAVTSLDDLLMIHHY
jgi:hypothetical protein